MKKASSLLLRIIKKARKNRVVRVLLTLAASVAAWNLLMWGSTLLFPLPEKLTSGYSEVFLSKKGELLRIGLSPEGRYRIRLSPGEASKYVREGFLCYEDRYFFLHPGVNPFSLLRAVRLNITKGKVVSGGSTITMQLARMLDHPGQKRSALLKMQEILRALQFEWKYSKAELLEFYMNTAPMGGNIEGAGAASYLYFGKPASSLSAGQAALLVGLPKAPGLSRPDVSPKAALKTRNKVLALVSGKLGLSREEYARALYEKIPLKRRDNPFRVPHLVLRASGTGSGDVKTLTVDTELQSF